MLFKQKFKKVLELRKMYTDARICFDSSVESRELFALLTSMSTMLDEYLYFYLLNLHT